jgi:hypothetical protein
MRTLMRLSLFKFLLVSICLIDEITVLWWLLLLRLLMHASFDSLREYLIRRTTAWLSLGSRLRPQLRRLVYILPLTLYQTRSPGRILLRLLLWLLQGHKPRLLQKWHAASSEPRLHLIHPTSAHLPLLARYYLLSWALNWWVSMRSLLLRRALSGLHTILIHIRHILLWNVTLVVDVAELFLKLRFWPLRVIEILSEPLHRTTRDLSHPSSSSDIRWSSHLDALVTVWDILSEWLVKLLLRVSIHFCFEFKLLPPQGYN